MDKPKQNVKIHGKHVVSEPCKCSMQQNILE